MSKNKDSTLKAVYKIRLNHCHFSKIKIPPNLMKVRSHCVMSKHTMWSGWDESFVCDGRVWAGRRHLLSCCSNPALSRNRSRTLIDLLSLTVVLMQVMQISTETSLLSDSCSVLHKSEQETRGHHEDGHRKGRSDTFWNYKVNFTAVLVINHA